MTFIILFSQNCKVQAADSAAAAADAADAADAPTAAELKAVVAATMFDPYVQEASQAERERITQHAKVLSKTLKTIKSVDKFMRLVQTATDKEKLIELVNSYNPETAIPGIFYACMNIENENPLVRKKFRETMKYLKEYLKENPEFNLDVVDSDGDTVAHFAALMGYDEIIKLLVEIERQDLFSKLNQAGETPLMGIFSNIETFSESYRNTIRLLLQYEGVNINKKYQDGKSMLHDIAFSEKKEPEILRLFLETEGIDRNPIFSNVTPLMILINLYPDTAKKLNIFLEGSTENDFKNPELTESDPFEFAIGNDKIDIELLKKLIQKGNIDVKTYKSPGERSALYIAINVLNENKINFFIKSGISVSDKFYKSDGSDKGTPLFVYLNCLLDLEKNGKSLPKNSEKIIATLLGKENPKDIIDNSFNYLNFNLFHTLMNFKDKQFVNRCLETLLKFNPDERLFNMQKILTDQNKSLGDTPLMIAIRNKDIRSVKRLLPLSDLTLINAEGNTYLMLAAQFYEEDIYNLILSKFQQEEQFDMLEVENKEGRNYKELIPDDIKKARELVREEERSKWEERVKRDLKLAKEIRKLEQEEKLQQEALEIKKAADKAQKESVKADTLDQSASAEDVPQAPTAKSRFAIKRTRKLKRWHNLSRIENPQDRIIYAEDTLKLDGYFEDPKTETDPIRKSRAKLYASLIIDGPKSESKKQQAIDQIIFWHAVPPLIAHIVLEKHSLFAPIVGSKQFKISNFPIAYTMNGKMYEGTYEVYGYIDSDNTISIYHELLRETKEIEKRPDTSSVEEEQFTLLNRFIHTQEEQSDKIKHTIYDQLTKNSYMFEVGK